MGVCEIFEVVGLCYDIIDKRVKFSESGSFHVKSFEHFYILPCDWNKKEDYFLYVNL